MEKEFIEVLTLIKESSFENKSFYIFTNEKGDFRSLESDKFDTPLTPGVVIKAKMRKKGCANREIMELSLC